LARIIPIPSANESQPNGLYGNFWELAKEESGINIAAGASGQDHFSRFCWQALLAAQEARDLRLRE
jgi:hypothetical protein